MQDQLLEIVEKMIGGSEEDYQMQVQELFYKRMNSLVAPIIRDKDECQQAVEKISHALYFEIQSLEDTEGFYEWAYRFVTVEAYSIFIRTHGRLFHSTTRSKMHYKYQSLDHDKELKQCLLEKKKQDKGFSKKLMNHLSVRKVVLYQMYCMEKCSIDDISDMLRVDKKVIRAKVGELRQFILDFDVNDEAKSNAAESSHVQNGEEAGKGHRSVRKEERHVTRRERIISYVFLGVFVVIGLVSGVHKAYEAKTTPTIYKTRYQTVYDGVDYSLVYNYNYYRWKYDDIDEKFGDSDEEALLHFVRYGMAEGRQAIETFNPIVYRDNNSDIKEVYGDDTKGYYFHYINSGYAEARKAME